MNTRDVYPQSDISKFRGKNGNGACPRETTRRLATGQYNRSRHVNGKHLTADTKAPT